MQLSVIILSYNTKDILEKCLDNLRLRLSENFSSSQYEILVLDNDSKDWSIEFLKEQKDIKTIFLKKNIGFAAGNNLAVKQAKGKYLLFLNSDVILSKRIDFKELIKFLESKENNFDKGALTIKLLLDDNIIDQATHRGLPTPWNSLCYFSGLEKITKGTFFAKWFGGYHMTYCDLNKIHEIDALSAAFLLMKRSLFIGLSGFDEQYFMYGEDLDLCYRIKEKQYSLWYYPRFTAYHLKYQSGFKSTNKQTKQKIVHSFYQTMELFYDKHLSKRYPLLLNLLVKTGIRLLKLIKTRL